MSVDSSSDLDKFLCRSMYVDSSPDLDKILYRSMSVGSSPDYDKISTCAPIFRKTGYVKS